MSPNQTWRTEEASLYCTFRLAHLHIGVDVRRVQEVIRDDRLTPVPLAPREVKGLINLRGQIITVLDLRSRLGLPDHDPADTNVVIQSGDETLSLLVDGLGDVVAPAPEDYEQVPVAVPERVRQVISGAFKLDHHLLLVVDPDRVVASLAGRT